MTITLTAPPVLAFGVTVTRVRRLSPSFVRVTFGGPSLSGFHSGGPLGTRDLRVKLMIPSPSHGLPDLSDMSEGWYQRWLALPDEQRGFMRTYTVRTLRHRSETVELDIDFVLHPGSGGPAAAWAERVRPGEAMTIIGPNGACTSYAGVEWQPPRPVDGPVRVLLAGDETAVPAIGAILESLPAGYTGHAVLEVPDPGDFQDMRTAADVEIRWLARGSAQHGVALADVVRGLVESRPSDVGDLPDVDIDRTILWETGEPEDASFYAWIAGEAAVVRDLRRYLVRDASIPRRQVAFMGYWRRGRAEG